MDSLTPKNWMPPEVPLPRPIQDLRAHHRDASAPRWTTGGNPVFWRLATFLPALLTTLGLIAAFGNFMSDGGLTTLEYVLIGLVGLTFFWIAFAVATASAGLLRLLFAPAAPKPETPAPMTVALLVPIYNENASEVFGNAAAMLGDLEKTGSAHDFTLFILSDTQDPVIAEEEARAMALLHARGVKAHYRRRARNTDRKAGNLADWTERWGGGYAAMIVLDADSLMSGAALVQLTDALSADPSAGLIQSSPTLIGAQTLFGRVQQFSNVVYGALLSEGLATWTGREGNYWGHNAIIRTKAFASCAGLPRMPSLRGRGALILSHDFVEAGLLRRAGWAVRFLPNISGSYEEPPATLVDYALRDRRWCHGNLQHLAILPASGFHSISRFHLFHGAMSYLLSTLWFALLVIWALLGNGEASVIRYFSPESPLYPSWPEMSRVSSFLILLFMYAMLLAPKIMGAAALSLYGMTPARLGGRVQFVLSLLIEVVASILLAPIMMVQQVVAVLRTLSGRKAVWAPQARAGGHYDLWTLIKFHALETLIGAALAAGMALGLVSLWLLPIAISLICAVPISAASRFDMSRWAITRNQLGTPEVFDEPVILRRAKAERARFRQLLTETPKAAE